VSRMDWTKVEATTLRYREQLVAKAAAKYGLPADSDSVGVEFAVTRIARFVQSRLPAMPREDIEVSLARLRQEQDTVIE
jgi:hypothetical protein